MDCASALLTNLNPSPCRIAINNRQKNPGVCPGVNALLMRETFMSFLRFQGSPAMRDLFNNLSASPPQYKNKEHILTQDKGPGSKPRPKEALRNILLIRSR
jgi:hypothetical protein